MGISVDVELPPPAEAEQEPGSDVEKDAAPTRVAPFPTRMDVFYDLNGSLGFAVGSSGFILAMYFEDWLPYFRYGSLAWIWGCVLYSIPLLQKMRGTGGRGGAGGFPWNLGETGEFLCYLFYVIGCVLGGFFDEERVERYLPAINHMFVYGSFSLVLEPAHQVFLFLTRGGGCMERMAVTRLCGSSPSPPRVGEDAIPDGDSATGSASTDTGSRTVPASNLGKPQPQLRLHWDRALELSATAFFCAAGVFGGFPPHPSLALPGVYFWEVGSLFSVARSVLLIRRRGRGLRLRRLGAAADAEDGAL